MLTVRFIKGDEAVGTLMVLHPRSMYVRKQVSWPNRCLNVYRGARHEVFVSSFGIK